MDDLPSGKLTVCELENGPVEIVDLPINSLVIFHIDPVQGAGQNHPKHKLHQAHDLPRAKRRADRGEYLGQSTRGIDITTINGGLLSRNRFIRFNGVQEDK